MDTAYFEVGGAPVQKNHAPIPMLVGAATRILLRRGADLDVHPNNPAIVDIDAGPVMDGDARAVLVKAKKAGHAFLHAQTTGDHPADCAVPVPILVSAFFEVAGVYITSNRPPVALSQYATIEVKLWGGEGLAVQATDTTVRVTEIPSEDPHCRCFNVYGSSIGNTALRAWDNGTERALAVQFEVRGGGTGEIIRSPNFRSVTTGTVVHYELKGVMGSESLIPRWFAVWDVDKPDDSPLFGYPEVGVGLSCDIAWKREGHHKVVCVLPRVQEGKYELDQVVVPIGPSLRRAFSAYAVSDEDPKIAEHAIEAARGEAELYEQSLRLSESRGWRDATKRRRLERKVENLRAWAKGLEDLLIGSTKRYPLKATLWLRQEGRPVRLLLFLCHFKSGWRLIDYTSPAISRMLYQADAMPAPATAYGAAPVFPVQPPSDPISNLISAWQSGNQYPPGRVQYEVPHAGKAGTFDATGASMLGEVADWLDCASTGALILAGAATLLAAPQAIVAGLFWASVFASTASQVVNVADRLSHGEEHRRQAGIDAIEIAICLLPIARRAGSGARVAEGIWTKGGQVLGHPKFGAAQFFGNVGIGAEAGLVTLHGILVAKDTGDLISQTLAEEDPERRADGLKDVIPKLVLRVALEGMMIDATFKDLNAALRRPPRTPRGKTVEQTLKDLGNEKGPPVNLDDLRKQVREAHTSDGRAEHTTETRLRNRAWENENPTDGCPSAPAEPAYVVSSRYVVFNDVAPDHPLRYAVLDVNPHGGTENCGECVLIVDQRLRGYDLNRGAPASLSGRLYQLEEHFGREFQVVSGPAEIVHQMRAAGRGRRGIVYACTDGDDMGHVFNVVNYEGEILFLDGQLNGQAWHYDYSVSTWAFILTN